MGSIRSLSALCHEEPYFIIVVIIAAAPLFVGALANHYSPIGIFLAGFALLAATGHRDQEALTKDLGDQLGKHTGSVGQPEAAADCSRSPAFLPSGYLLPVL